MAFFNVPANPANPVMLEIVCDADVAETDTTTQKVVNIFHFAGRGTNPGSLSAAGIISSFVTWWNANVAPRLSEDYPDTAVANCRILDDPTNLPGPDGGLDEGGQAGDRLPTLAAVSMDLISDSRGRCFRGRKHFGPIAEDAVTGDEIDPTELANWNAMASTIAGGLSIDDGGGNFFDLCVLSRINSNLIGPAVYFTYAIVKSAIVQPKIGTMKRRKEGIGV